MSLRGCGAAIRSDNLCYGFLQVSAVYGWFGNTFLGGILVPTSLVKAVFSSSRSAKRAIQAVFDLVAIALCFWVAMVLRLDGVGASMHADSWIVLVPVAPITILAFVKLGLYRAVVRFMADRALKAVALGVAISAVTMFVVSQMFGLFVPRSVPGIYFALLLIVVGGTRMLMRAVYLSLRDQERAPVLIYGAGEEGRQILQALEHSRNYRPALFVEEDAKLRGSEIGGLRIVGLDQVESVAARLGVKTALLSISGRHKEKQRHVAKLLADYGLEVRVIPSVSDLVSGRVRVSQLQRINVVELLGREPVPPIPELLGKTVAGKSVLVTGAGGSIGSEICRQILDQAPRRIVLFDVSEFALYRILEELTERLTARGGLTELVAVLGSVARDDLIDRTIRANGIETLFHAAAYKHVPLVEVNAVEGFLNNVIGTHVVAEAAGRLGVSYFTLISTDKAVRPTNIMGATKRLAELVMQASSEAYPNTKYCAVRFGNVLASSGSVIPKFEKQIAAGGPITLTHPEITRYFMTIPEAAQLVVQASSMAKSGEIYLLDMGEPIKILDLARAMARLQGHETFLQGVEPSRDGAIEIQVTGLRPGEKLYEELLVTGEEARTRHPRIMCEPSRGVDRSDVLEWLGMLQSQDDNVQVATTLKQLPLGYSGNPSGG